MTATRLVTAGPGGAAAAEPTGLGLAPAGLDARLDRHPGIGGASSVPLVEFAFEGCTLDLDRQTLCRDGEVVPLEPRALLILRMLIEHRNRVVTKNELLDAVWGDRFVSESALTTQIKAIRRAIGDSGREQRMIKTLHGRGYMFVAGEEAAASGQPLPTAPTGERRDRSEPTIAVLPFENLTDDGQSHVAAGLTSDIVTVLAKHRWLRVSSQITVNRYAALPDAVERLRGDLGVDYVVEGAVRREGSRLRVTVTLTDTVDMIARWSERYDREFEHLFAVQDEITQLIVATIEPEVGYAERERVSRSPHTDLRAWDLYHLGVAHFFRFTAADNLEAQRLLAKSRELDPTFGEAHAWWAYATVLGMVYWDTEPNPDTLEEALDATQQALGVDDHNAVFHALRGRVQLARREYRSALGENLRAIELNPTFAAAYCGLGDSLCYEGRYAEALQQFERAVDLGQHDPQRWAFLSYGALALLFAERYEDAVEWAERATTIPNCQYWAFAHRLVALTRLGRTEEIAAARAELVRRCPEFTIAYARAKLFYLKRPEQLDLYLGSLADAGIAER